MLLRLLVAAGIVGFILHWLIPAIRQRVVFEIEFGCAVACLWASIYVLWVRGEILAPLLSLPGWLTAGGAALWILSVVLFVVSAASLRARGKPERGWEETTVLSTGGVHGHAPRVSGKTQ